MFLHVQLLGFDILLTEAGQSFLLEVNHSPSFHVESPVDMTVKSLLLKNTLQMLNIDVNNRMKYHNNLSLQTKYR